MRDLSNVVEWLERANRSMFNHFNLKCVLYIIENSYTKPDEQGNFKQKRRSFPLESVFFNHFPDMYGSLLSYIKEKLLADRSEVRLALVLRPFSIKKAIKTEMRVNMMTESSNSADAYQKAINKEESVLFDETETELEEKSVKSFDKPSNSEGDEILGSTASLTSVVAGSNDISKKRAVKLFDKTKRAFSISIESSKAFELAIRKPREGCSACCTRVRASFYSLYVLMVK